MAHHRGTARATNTALHTTQLLLGADKAVMLINMFFWGYTAFGIGFNFQILICLVGFTICFIGLRFVAKSDAQAVPVFRSNSRFLVQKPYYPCKGSVNFHFKAKKVNAIAFNRVSKTPKGG